MSEEKKQFLDKRDYAEIVTDDAYVSSTMPDTSEQNHQRIVNQLVDSMIVERSKVTDQMNHVPYDELDVNSKKRVNQLAYNYFLNAKDTKGSDNKIFKEMAIDKFILVHNPSIDFEHKIVQGNLSTQDSALVFKEMFGKNHYRYQEAAIQGMKAEHKNEIT